VAQLKHFTRVVDRWNNLDQDSTVDAPSLNCFENRLNKIRCARMGFFMDWSAKPYALPCGLTSR